jgi:hypothetical protein
MRIYLALCAAALAVVVGTGLAAEDKDPLAAAKCPVSGEAVSADQSVAYRDAKVYFCCDKCLAAFEKDSAKHAPKANLQLVATGQYKQEKCPLSGQAVNKEKTVKVTDVQVNACCDNCLKKANDTKEEDRVALLFADKAFEKGFVIVKEEPKK